MGIINHWKKKSAVKELVKRGLSEEEATLLVNQWDKDETINFNQRVKELSERLAKELY